MKIDLLYMMDILYDYDKGEISTDFEYIAFIKKYLKSIIEKNEEVIMTEENKNYFDLEYEILKCCESNSIKEIIALMKKVSKKIVTYEEKIPKDIASNIKELANFIIFSIKERYIEDVDPSQYADFVSVYLPPKLLSIIKTRLHYEYLEELLQDQYIMIAEDVFEKIINKKSNIITFIDNTEYIFKESYDYNEKEFQYSHFV